MSDDETLENVTLPLDLADAQALLPALKAARANASKEDKALFDKTAKILDRRIAARQQVMAEQADQEKCEQQLDRMVKLTQKVMGKPVYSMEALDYLEGVGKVWDKAVKSYDATLETYISQLPRSKRQDVARLPFELFSKIMTPYERQLVQLGEDFKNGPQTPLAASEDYTLPEKRLKMARRCIATTTKYELSGCEEMEIVGNDMASFAGYAKFARALLAGVPYKIERVYTGLSSSIRDALDEPMWDFMNRLFEDDSIQAVKKASAPKRPGR